MNGWCSDIDDIFQRVTQSGIYRLMMQTLDRNIYKPFLYLHSFFLFCDFITYSIYLHTVWRMAILVWKRIGAKHVSKSMSISIESHNVFIITTVRYDACMHCYMNVPSEIKTHLSGKLVLMTTSQFVVDTNYSIIPITLFYRALMIFEARWFHLKPTFYHLKPATYHLRPELARDSNIINAR